MKRLLFLIVVLFLLSAAFAVAGGQQEPGGAEKAKVVKVWPMTFPPHVNGFTAVGESFMKENPGVQIKIEAQADIATKVKSGIASGVLADLFMVRAEDFFEYVASGALAPLPENVITYAELENEFWPEYSKQAPFGKVYAIGVADPFGDAGIVCNVDMFEEAGLKVPGRFNDRNQLMEYAKKLTKKDASGAMIQAGLSSREYNDTIYFWSFIVDQGGKFYDNQTKKFNFNTSEGKAALQWWYDLSHAHDVDSTNLPDTFDALSQQVAAMGFMWGEYIPFSRINFPDSNFGFAVKPPFVGTGTPALAHNDTWNLGAYEKSPNKDVAIDFLAYLRTEEAQKIFLEENPGIPPLKSMIDDPFFDTDRGSFLKPLTKLVDQVKFYGPFGNASQIAEASWKTIDGVIHDSMSVEEGLVQMTKDANHALDIFEEKYPQYGRPTVEW